MNCCPPTDTCVRESVTAALIRPLRYIRGIDADGCVAYADVRSLPLAVDDTRTIDLSVNAGTLIADLRVSGQVGNQIQVLPDGVYVPPISSTLNVQDTNTVDLTLAGGTLSASVIVSPVAGNQLQATPQGLFVPPAAGGITVQDTNTVDLTLAGGTLSASVIVSPAAGNQLQATPQGLFVPPAASSLNVQDTTTVDLTLAGGTLSADVVVSPAAGNQLQVTPQGLFVPPAASSLNVQDTTTVDLTVSGTTLSADVIVSPAAGNQLQVTPQGLYVPPSAGGITVQDTNTIDLTLSGSTLSAQAIVAPNNSLQATPNGLAVDLRDCNGNILPAGARLIQCGNLAPTDLPIGGTFIATAPGTAYRVRSVPCGSAPTHVLVGTGGNIVAAQRDGLGHTLGTIAMLPFVFFSFGNGAHVFDSVTITNPSQCRHLVVQVNGWGLGTLSCPANQLATIGFGVDDGLFFILDLGLSLYSASGFANALWGSLKERTALFIIPPGGSKTIRRIGDMTYGNCTVQVDSTFTFSGYLVSLL